MKITDPGPDIVRAATQGDLAALDALLLALQPGVFNLAVRMLGNRDDAADAAQEILLKVVTHLAGFRGESAFTTWVFRIARNHLLDAATRSRESPEVSLEAIEERLGAGLALADRAGRASVLTPEDKAEARQVALRCTQNMLMALDRADRLVYLLDAIFGLASRQAADVLEITPEAYRQRLARARARLDDFGRRNCGLVQADAACRCERQLDTVRHVRAQGQALPPSLHATHGAEAREAERGLASIVRMGDAAALFKAHPQYRAPESMRAAILAVLQAEGWSERRH